MDGATVTFTNNATGASQSATTDGSGNFTFSNLTPGTYKVAVRMRSGLQLSESSIEINPTNSNQIQVMGERELTGILRWATGTPYTVSAEPLACACLGISAVPANFSAAAVSSVNGAASFDASLFTTPAAGTFGSLSRNVFRGTDLFVYNAALFRNFAVTENVKLEFRGEAYNIANTTNFANPIANSGLPVPGGCEDSVLNRRA